MGRVDNVRTIIQRIKEAVERINQSNAKLQQAMTPGLRQSLVNTIHENSQKIKHLMKRVQDMTQGAVIQVDFEVISESPEKGKKFRVFYTNMEEKEAKDLITLLMKVQGVDIRVLECSRIITQNQIIPL